jgi:hypothetical protein
MGVSSIHSGFYSEQLSARAAVRWKTVFWFSRHFDQRGAALQPGVNITVHVCKIKHNIV